MRCPPDAGSSFLVIAVQNFTHGILSVNEDRIPISITRKSRDHGSPQTEKKLKTPENSENPRNQENKPKRPKK
jgi:hypothetical protein